MRLLLLTLLLLLPPMLRAAARQPRPAVLSCRSVQPLLPCTPPTGHVCCYCSAGLNNEGQLGVPPYEVANSTAAVPVATDIRFSVLSAGGDYTCGVVA